MANIPKHVAIIMDGNGRWAKQRNLPRIAGHQAGAKVVREIVEHSAQIGIQFLTLFAFSTENRNRPDSEVQFLMSLFLETLQKNTAELHANNVKLRIIGDRKQFSPELLQQVDASEQLTANNSGLTLIIAMNYSGRWEMLQAAKKIATAVAENQLQLENITIEHFQQSLCFSDFPDPDLLIRTSGEQRISNFMLWQFAYTELYFPDVLWPDFSVADFKQALHFYQSRQRRFGLIEEQLEYHDA
jgi:undecaprenyl diphosphate synthase